MCFAYSVPSSRNVLPVFCQLSFMISIISSRKYLLNCQLNFFKQYSLNIYYEPVISSNCWEAKEKGVGSKRERCLLQLYLCLIGSRETENKQVKIHEIL